MIKIAAAIVISFVFIQLLNEKKITILEKKAVKVGAAYFSKTGEFKWKEIRGGNTYYIDGVFFTP